MFELTVKNAALVPMAGLVALSGTKTDVSMMTPGTKVTDGLNVYEFVSVPFVHSRTVNQEISDIVIKAGDFDPKALVGKTLTITH